MFHKGPLANGHFDYKPETQENDPHKPAAVHKPTSQFAPTVDLLASRGFERYGKAASRKELFRHVAEVVDIVAHQVPLHGSNRTWRALSENTHRSATPFVRQFRIVITMAGHREQKLCLLHSRFARRGAGARRIGVRRCLPANISTRWETQPVVQQAPIKFIQNDKHAKNCNVCNRI